MAALATLVDGNTRDARQLGRYPSALPGPSVTECEALVNPQSNADLNLTVSVSLLVP